MLRGPVQRTGITVRTAGAGARRTIALPGLALALVGLAGCVAVRSAPAPFAAAWPPRDTGPRPAIVLMVSGAATIDGIPRPLGPILDPWGAATERAYRESALFAAVEREPGRGDLRVEVELRADHSVPVPLALLAYLTLFVIPNVETTELAMTTRVVTDDGHPLGTFEVRGRSRTWYQLLLFPVAPFFEPRMVTPDIVYDLNRETITVLHARGVF
jgi:hypothetical protein